MAMLQARGLHKYYPSPVERLHVLKGVDLTINEGDVWTIVGPSGAGKSTLLHILGALDAPSEGNVIFDDQDIYRLKEQERARIRNTKFGFIFQFYHLLPEFTALENVMLPAMVGSSRESGEKNRAMDLLERVGLKARAAHRPSELSGGEQQRVAIARALINAPTVIFCDEPTGNLDSQSGQDIIGLLMELNAKNNQTLVIVTHDESLARRSKNIITMRDGQLDGAGV